MASILKVDKIRVTGSDSDTMSFDGTGNITMPKNVTFSGTVTGDNSDKVLIKEISASSVATVEFIHGSNGVTFDGTYEQYYLEILRMLPATDNVQVTSEITTDGGSSYKSSGYVSVGKRAYYNGSGGHATDSTAQTTKWYPHTGNVSSDGGRGGLYLTARLTKPTVSQFQSIYGFAAIHTDDNYSIPNSFQGCYDDSPTTYNGFRFKFSSGDIASGRFRLYGIK